MDGNPLGDLQQIVTIMLILAGISLVLALVLMAYIVWRVRRIHLPPDADPITALRATPLIVVIMLDLLDFSLDFLSAPFSWVILGYLGLKPLRGVTVAESIIPFTQFLPTMTVAWIFARLTDPDRQRAGPMERG
ncbi:MAG: hypothetical protein GX495_08165 [Chloroflexi bacterium]|jgi:hypothetical protein|nr:hypothetical protein [Chloroflexota bacterium]